MKETFSPAELNRLDSARLRRYRELLDFYNGKHWQNRARPGEKQLTFNYARVVIDKLASYLMTGMKIVVDPAGNSELEKAQARRAEAALARIGEDNNLEQLDFETEVDCAVLGDAVYKVVWDTNSASVRVTAPDAQGVYVWHEPDDYTRQRRVAVKYALDAAAAATLYDLKTRNRTVSLVELWTAADFELWADETRLERKPNPYGFIPFIVFPNLRAPKERWGISDLEPVIAPQQEFNRAVSQLSRILELSGNPIAVLENVESSEDIAVKPGAVWNLPEDAKAYLLDLLQGGGVQLHIEYINLLYRTLHDVSESPRAAFGGIEKDLSGVALEIEMQPLLQKVGRKRAIRTAVYTRRARLMLRLLEKFTGEDYGGGRVRVVWNPVLPRDTARTVANEQVMVQGGMHSRRTAMNELGINDPEAEFSRWLEERAAILKMNRNFNARAAKNGAGVRDNEASGESSAETGGSL